MNRTQFWIASGVVLLAVAFVGWKSSRPPVVEVTVVRLDNVTSTLAFSGVLEASKRTAVSSQLNGGLVREVRVDIGSSVHAGDILVVLDDSEFRAQLQSADALIEQSNSQANLQDVIANTASNSVGLAREGLASVNDLRASVASSKAAEDVAATKFQQSIVNLERVRNASRIEQVLIAKAKLSRAIAVWELSRQEAIRLDVLAKEGAIAQKQSEAAQSALATSTQDVKAAREEVVIAGTPRPEDVLVAESQVAEARAAMAGASQALTFAQRVLSERLANRQQLVKAEGELSNALATRKVTEATKLGGSAQRVAALSAIAKTVIRAPFDGKVAQRLVEPGQTVTVGTSMITLDGVRQLRVRLNVEEASIALVKVGAKATVGFDAFPELHIPADVSEIGTSANFQLGTVEVRLNLQSGDSRLKPGLTADANIFIAVYSQVATVRPSALVTSGETSKVYVVDDGVVRDRVVTWAKGNSDSIVIRSGLSAGDLVLSNPRATTPGTRVNVKATKGSRPK